MLSICSPHKLTASDFSWETCVLRYNVSFVIGCVAFHLCLLEVGGAAETVEGSYLVIVQVKEY